MESQQIVYPNELAPRGDTIDEYKSKDGSIVKVPDPYRALEDPDAEGTKAWVQAQNVLTQNFLAKCDLREKIAAKLGDLQKYAKMGVPHKHGDNFYFSYNSGLQNQALIYKITAPNVHEVSEQDPTEGTQVLLDPNTLAEDGTAALRKSVWSPNGKYMAYQVSRGGSDWAEIYIRDCESLKDLDDHLKWVKFSQVTWTHDNVGFFYQKYDAPKSFENKEDAKAGTETDKDSAQKVFYHRVGTSQEEDVLIYQNAEDALAVYFTVLSSCGKYLLNNRGVDCDDDIYTIQFADISNENMDKEIAFKRLDTKLDGKGMSYVHSIGTKFYFRSSYGCFNYKVICVDFEKPEEENWTDVVPEHEKNVLEEVQCCHGKIIATYMENVSNKLKVYDFDGKFLADIQLPGIGSAGGRGSGNLFLYKFMSFTDPGSMWSVNMDTYECKRIFQTKLGAINLDEFQTDQVWFPSKDGTQIPMFVIRKKSTLPTMETVPEKPIVTMMYGYGGFNVNITPAFSANRLVLLNNLGGMLCVVTLRGGGEFGEKWHKQGMLDTKQNCFDDFCAAGEYLIEKKLTSPENLHINGGSNGGLLVTVCANQRPELFAGAIAQVPVTDMLRFQKFTCGYQWCGDYGNAEEGKGDVDYQIKFSPVHNVKAQIYPAMMLTTADHDDRVVPLHTFKYIADLQYTAGSLAGQRPLLTRIDINAGHGGGMPTAKIIQLYADIFGFIAKVSNAEWKD